MDNNVNIRAYASNLIMAASWRVAMVGNFGSVSDTRPITF